MLVYLTAMIMPTQVYALESDLTYSYSNTQETVFGKSTSVEPVETIEVTNTYNINVSKDSSFIPPIFGSYSADTKGTGELLTPNISGVSPMIIGTGSNSLTGTTTQNTSTGYMPYSTTSDIAIPPQKGNVTYNISSQNKFTLPDGLYYSDNSIGKLKIPSIGLSVKVYETESLESLAKGAGHFKSTSCWDGNVGLCGHNRGVTNHFGKIHTLEKGDEIQYTTKLGTRTYEVVSVNKINETNFSYLGRTSDNRITLITCVNDEPAKRWCVQAVEK